MILDEAFISRTKAAIEQAMLPAMEKFYLHDRDSFDESYRPGLKYIEKVVSYYDYYATGISVLAAPAARGDERAMTIIRKIHQNMMYYRREIFGHTVGDRSKWRTPLRRLIFHAVLAYDKLRDVLTQEEKDWYCTFMAEEVDLAIEHCRNFLPGEKDLHLASVNNHTAIFMQGIYHAGKVFDRPKWMELTLDFARRFFDSGHPDGYFEEHTNEAREGGPSMVYTPLTVGCLYDVLDGKHGQQEKFIKAGDFFRSFTDFNYERILIADERTNSAGRSGSYGLALHSLTDRGRQFIIDNIELLDFNGAGTEAMAVMHHELDLMLTGQCATPESRCVGNSRIALPLGVVRKNGFTAGISALLALNRTMDRTSTSDYALDQQNMVCLSHAEAGTILTGVKSKYDPQYSTMRIGDDAYTVRTGELDMGDGWAEAHLHYQSFDATIRWEIGDAARLILSTDCEKEVTTALPIVDESLVKTATPFETKMLKGFSPYTADNESSSVKAIELRWKKQLVIDFAI